MISRNAEMLGGRLRAWREISIDDGIRALARRHLIYLTAGALPVAARAGIRAKGAAALALPS